MTNPPAAVAPGEEAALPLGRSARWLLSALAFAPAALAAWLVATHAVNVPVWDDWERARLVQAWENGTLDFAYLYSPHIDHRILIPRLVALANAALFGMDLRLEMGLAFAVVLASALGAHILLRRSLGTRPGLLYGSSFLVNLLLFTPLQWENFLWAAQPFFVLPLGALLLAFAVLASELSLAARFAGCLLIALVSSHTFSHGLVLWPAVFAAALLQRDFAPPRERATFLAAWAVAAAAVMVPYFSVGGFRNTSLPGHAFGVATGERVPSAALGEVLADPLRAVRFLFGCLGSPVARVPYLTTARAALWSGVAIAGPFASAVALWLVRWRDPRSFDRGLPWVLVGGSSLGLCALAATGRTALRGWVYSILPHYISISLYVPVATIALLALAVRERRARRSHALRAAPAAAAGFAAALLAYGWLVGMAGMDEWRSGRLQARTSLLYINYFKPHHQKRLDSSSSSLEVLRELADALNRHGLLDPPLLPDRRLSRFAIDERPLAVELARLESARVEGGRLVLAGFAWLPDVGRRADGVLLTAREAGERFVVALLELMGMPATQLPHQDYIFDAVWDLGPAQFARLEDSLELAQLPAGDEIELEAWAVDADRMRVRRFAQVLSLRRTPAGVQLELLGGGQAARGPG